MASNWAIVPALDLVGFTQDAITDLLAQTSIDCRVLLVNQGSADPSRLAFEALAEAHHPRVLLWSHAPALTSLSATWNRALDFVWSVGGTEALVVNDDVRLAPWTYRTLLDALRDCSASFVTAVGVREVQYEAYLQAPSEIGPSSPRGGPDFSCFLISRACHAKFKFDEAFVPAYKEDCSFHREMMLAGQGADIFSVNLPYLHYASRTVNSFTPAQQASFAKRVAQSQRHYIKCWGGDVNAERFTRKGDPTSAQDGVTNPELQARVQGV